METEEPNITGELARVSGPGSEFEVVIRMNGAVVARQSVIDPLQGETTLQNLLSAVRIAYGADEEGLAPERAFVRRR